LTKNTVILLISQTFYLHYYLVNSPLFLQQNFSMMYITVNLSHRSCVT